MTIERSKLDYDGKTMCFSHKRKEELCSLQERWIVRFRTFGPKTRQRMINYIASKDIECDLMSNADIDLDDIDDFSAACLFNDHPEIGELVKFLEKLHADLCIEEVLTESV